MAKDDPKPYRDDERAAVERAAELERELEEAHVTSKDEVTRPGRKALEAQLAATWARQFDAEAHRGSIVKVVPRPRWSPQPKTAEDLAADVMSTKRLVVIAAVAVIVIVVTSLALYRQKKAADLAPARIGSGATPFDSLLSS